MILAWKGGNYWTGRRWESERDIKRVNIPRSVRALGGWFGARRASFSWYTPGGDTQLRVHVPVQTIQIGGLEFGFILTSVEGCCTRGCRRTWAVWPCGPVGQSLNAWCADSSSANCAPCCKLAALHSVRRRCPRVYLRSLCWFTRWWCSRWCGWCRQYSVHASC
jgi:hypothetical protein